jgi:DhnA family fructose-bisphosphate aldolase class Ia
MDARETIPGILNITASTTRSLHTRKVLVGTPSEAVALGLDAVACHLNIGSKFESEQLSQTWQISRECELLGLPLVAIAYPRTETLTGEDDNFETLKRESPATYTEMVSHACRVAIELGADIVKTQYTGSPDTFSAVVAVCSPIPVLIAGGPLTSMANMLEVAFGAVSAGAAGVSFGRNVFASGEARLRIRALKAVVHDKAQPAEALNAAGLSK